MPTTSPPSRRSKSKSGSTPHSGPLKSIRLSVTLFSAGGALVERLASERGLSVERKGDDVKVTITAASPEEALAQLRLLGDLLAQKR